MVGALTGATKVRRCRGSVILPSDHAPYIEAVCNLMGREGLLVVTQSFLTKRSGWDLSSQQSE